MAYRIGDTVTARCKIRNESNVGLPLRVNFKGYDKWSTYSRYLVGAKYSSFDAGETKEVSCSFKIPAFFAATYNGVTAEVVYQNQVLDSETRTDVCYVVNSNVERLSGGSVRFCLCKGVDTSTKPWQPIEPTTTFSKKDTIYAYIYIEGARFMSYGDELRYCVTCLPLSPNWYAGTSYAKWSGLYGDYNIWGYAYFSPPKEWPAGTIRFWAYTDFKSPLRYRIDAQVV